MDFIMDGKGLTKTLSKPHFEIEQKFESRRYSDECVFLTLKDDNNGNSTVKIKRKTPVVRYRNNTYRGGLI